MLCSVRSSCVLCSQLEYRTACRAQVLAVPLLAGSSFGDSRGIPLVTWLSGLGAIVGVSLLEQSGAAPGIGDVWSLLSAVFFGVQVRILSQSCRWVGALLGPDVLGMSTKHGPPLTWVLRFSSVLWFPQL